MRFPRKKLLNLQLANRFAFAPDLYLDFRSGVIDPRLTTSGGANGTVFDATGTLVSATCPRFDYNPTTGACLGLLVEEQRTNLLIRSEEMDNAAAWFASGVTVSANAAAAPTGALTADKVIPTASASTFKELQQNYAGTTSGTTYTYSLFCKADGYNFVQLVGSSAAFGTFWYTVNVSTGVETDFGAGTSTVVGRGVQPCANGWYRVWIALTALSTASGRISADIVPASTSVRGVSWTANGTSGMLQWGAQLEAGAFPTSYIPTAGSAVTRTADSVTMTGNALTNVIRNDQGTLACEFIGNSVYTTVNSTALTLDDGTSSNNLNLRTNAAHTTLAFNLSLGATPLTGVDNGTTGAFTAGTTQRLALSYNSGNSAGCANGGAPITSTVAYSGSNFTTMRIGINRLATAFLNGTVASVRYWKQAANNDTLQRKTMA